MNESDEQNLVRALENVVLFDKMSWTMVNHLSTLPLQNNYSIFKAYFHRLLKEYGVDVVEVSNIREHLINATNNQIIVNYVAHHYGRELTALYSNKGAKPSLTLIELNSERSITFTIDEEVLESFANAIKNVKNPLQCSCSNADQRTISSLLAHQTMRLINFLDGKKEKGVSQQPTPAEPVFLTPTAPKRAYTLN